MENGEEEPSLDRFKEEINKYKVIEKEIQALPTSAAIGWLRIDARPLKNSLATWASKWIYLYTHYLEENAINTITELYDFISDSNTQLDTKVNLNSKILNI